MMQLTLLSPVWVSWPSSRNPTRFRNWPHAYVSLWMLPPFRHPAQRKSRPSENHSSWLVSGRKDLLTLPDGCLDMQGLRVKDDDVRPVPRPQGTTVMNSRRQGWVESSAAKGCLKRNT